MKHLKILLLSLVCLAATCPARAEIVTQKQASAIAETFFNTIYGMYVAKPKLAWNGRQLTTDRLFSPFYVYNHPKGGFVIIAADNKAFPILAYSDKVKFERDRLTDEENALLKRFAHEVELIRYDDRTPVRAVEAWGNLNQYIYNTVSNPYATPEYRALTDEEKETIERIDRRNNWTIMPTAVEFNLYDPEKYRDYTLDDVTAEYEEEVPFSFYEAFLAEIEEEKRTRGAALEEILSPTHPVVSILGGAHYAIRFPVNMTMARVYSMEGAKMLEKYYKGTDTVNIDLSSMPSGFYVLVALGEDGRMYGIKVYR